MASITLSQRSATNNIPVTQDASPFLERQGLFATHKPTYDGLDQLLILDKNWIICVVNTLPQLLDEVNTLSSGLLYTKQALWINNQDFVAYSDRWDIMNQYLIPARKNVGEVLMKNTNYYAISSTDDSNYSVAQEPSSVNRIYQPFGGPTDDGYTYNASGMVREQYRIYAYLNMPTAMQDGKTYTVTLDNGDAVTFLYDRHKTVSRAIKVNQVGYLPSSTKKYAYMGATVWNNTPLDLSHATSFEVINADTGEIALSGTPSLLASNPTADTIPAYGEDVYELDISALSVTGTFFISVPGVGRSWPFKHTANAYDQAAYIGIRHLFHQRIGQGLSAEHTNWPRRKASLGPYYYHSLYGPGTISDITSITQTGGVATVTTEKAHGISGAADIKIEGANEAGYNKTTNVTSTGTYTFTYSVDAGTASPATGTITCSAVVDRFDAYGGSTDRTNPIKEEPGGWHDAADWDSNSAHVTSIADLLYIYEWNPSAWFDGQLNIPESGNGVPDILSEARYGLEIFRIGMDENGGVPYYFETWTHPDSIEQYQTGSREKIRITSLTQTGGVATATTDKPHRLKIGRPIVLTIDGATPAGYELVETTVYPDTTTTFKYYVDSGLSSPATGTIEAWTARCDYSFSIPMRFSSARFAALAAQYSRLVAPFDAADALYYKNLAILAYGFASDETNAWSNKALAGTTSRGDGSDYTYNYNEDVTSPDTDLIWAKCQMYLLTNDETYLTGGDASLSTLLGRTALSPDAWPWHLNSFRQWISYSVIQAVDAGATAYSASKTTWENYYTSKADEYIAAQDPDTAGNHYYRQVWPINKEDSISWGWSHATRFNRILEIAYQITGLQKYRDALTINNDNEFGCNPLGTTYTSGVGYIYPVNFQHKLSYYDTKLDPVPGVTIYGITGSTYYKQFRENVWHTSNIFETEYSTGIAISSLTQSAGTATATSTAHGLSTGDQIRVEGATQSGYNIYATVTVIDADTFTFPVDSGTVSPATGSPAWRYAFIDEVNTTVPVWRKLGYHSIKNVTQNEFTHHEMFCTAFSMAVLCSGEAIKEKLPRDNDDLYAQWHLV